MSRAEPSIPVGVHVGVGVSTDIAAAVARLRAGGVVAVPTETVYGLAADAESPAAVGRLFDLKGRPRGHPMIVHVGAPELISEWAAEVPPTAALLAQACWPGPLTLLLRRSHRVLDVVTGGRDTVGIRVPAHPVAQRLLAAFGGGLAAPSANRFGKVSPTTAAHVAADLGDRLDPERDLILDGGSSTVGVESTIVDCTVDPPQVLRPGGIPMEDITAILGASPAAPPPNERGTESRAPGMLASHYAPAATLHLVEDAAAARTLIARLVDAGRDPVLADRTDDLVASARELYADLRSADRAGATDIVAVLPPAIGLGHAIRDRLTKAAGGGSTGRRASASCVDFPSA